MATTRGSCRRWTPWESSMPSRLFKLTKSCGRGSPRGPSLFAMSTLTGTRTRQPLKISTNRSDLPGRKKPMPPRSFLDHAAKAAEIVARFSKSKTASETSYATVRDYCESLDDLPQITGLDGDLKNVQRPWAVKALLRAQPPPARLLEIGGGEPIVSGFLTELGYDVTLVDPYDGSGNGPTEYEQYASAFPKVKLVRSHFEPDLRIFAPRSFDAIFSVSVLEHLSPESLANCFRAIEAFLKPDGASVHCFDFVLQGLVQEYDLSVANNILQHQARLEGHVLKNGMSDLLERLKTDTETFFLSPQGHHHWRGGLPYDQFPFRKVVSLQTIAFRSGT
ncbi:MAG: hypothetical protein DMF06_08540 [Verrucomicrobia bacterium]|nr:MAG: hypothetical protein DMF06_08540 [Verrucomicrobiota bacterium]